MPVPILATKLFVPRPRAEIVLRPRLIERLNDGLVSGRKLTLISAPAGFGKTMLVSEWIASCERPAAWLSLDERDNDPTRFLTYVIAALQALSQRGPNRGEKAEGKAAKLGAGVLAVLQSPQPPPTESILTTLINEITTIPDNFIFVLDDYHLIESRSVDHILAFLVEHQPPQMHLVISTREDPFLPVARLRTRGQLTELRVADLRFTPSEAADFLNRVMGLNLRDADIAALEARTEGWIAGLQLAGISIQGRHDATSFIRSFTGSHRFVVDYLVEEVLERQSENMQTFLLRTSILERLCAPLCDVVLAESAPSGQENLEYLEHANLFLVPLDDERRWYRYHHLFGDLLRKRLEHSLTPEDIAGLHTRASQWYEENGLVLQAFQHATAANDVERAERLMEGKGLPFHSRGAINVVLAWLASLPESVLDARPLLRVRSATMALTAGQTTNVEEKLQAAEKALKNAEFDPQSRDLIGQIACARATLAVAQYQTETVIIQARRALEYLLPENLRFRFTANWALSVAYDLQGDRAAAGQALAEALSINQTFTSTFSTVLAVLQMGQLQEGENKLQQAAETYRRALKMVSEQPQPNASDAYLGLARIEYEWNDLDAAEQHGQQGLMLARQFDRMLDRFILCEVLLARSKLARGDVDGAATMLARTEKSARQQDFVLRLPEIAGAQVLVLLRQGDVPAAARLAETFDLPISRARVFLAQGEASKALAQLSPLRQQMEAKGWQDERLRAMVPELIALQANGEKEKAAKLLGDELAQTESAGFVRLFVDEGEPMRLLILELRFLMKKQFRDRVFPQSRYVDGLLAAFDQPEVMPQSKISKQPAEIVEPLTRRELEVLRLIALGCSNDEIGKRLFLALDTVKGHNRRIFDKLQVQRRTEAVARARESGLI